MEKTPEEATPKEIARAAAEILALIEEKGLPPSDVLKAAYTAVAPQFVNIER